LWLRAGNAAAARDAVATIASWRRTPAPLAWMAEAVHRGDGLDAAWPLLAEQGARPMLDLLRLEKAGRHADLIARRRASSSTTPGRSRPA
jgi:hypothetical protein